MQRRAVAISALGTWLSLVAFTAPLTTLRDISVSLSAGPDGQSWILSSMSLGLTAALLTAGSLGDRFGRRRFFVVGAVLLGMASVVGALAPSTAVFVVGRLTQGVGAAAIIACSLAVIGDAIPAGPARARASGIWGAALAGGIASGPLIAAVLPWSVTYWTIAACATATAVAARMLLVESRSSTEHRLDPVGMLLLALGLAALLAGLTESRDGLGNVMPLVLLGAGTLLMVAFLVVEVRSTHPMMPVRWFADPVLIAATFGSLATGLGVIALMSFLPAVLQRAFGWPPATSALLLLGWSATSVVTALLTRRLPERVSATLRLAGGLGVVAAGMAVLLAVGGSDQRTLLVAALVIAGLGTGVVNATLGRQAIAAVPPDAAAVGSGINNTARYFGGAVGVTLVSVLAGPVAGETPSAVLAAFDRAVVLCVVLTVGCVLVVAGASSWCGRRGAVPGSGQLVDARGGT